MCGICGYINLDGQPADPEILGRMNRTLVHRGPDEQGQFLDRTVALGHRRLSIVDLARGQQPMQLPESPWTVVYNGEIYNHLQLREQLGMSPDSFRTSCDTETILRVFAQLGPDALTQLRGMFAFCLYNAIEQSLFIARDRLGIKPLYYYHDQRLFAFASEIKALLQHPDINASVNASQLPLQLALKYTLDDQTLYKGIRKLLPGHYLQLRGGQLSTHQYWDLSYVPKRQFSSMQQAAGEFRERFTDAVKARLMADVPLGVFLSGGIDSSVIAATMAGLVKEPIKAFSIAFQQRDYSELEYSRMVAQHVGADIREMVLSPDDWFAAWPRMVYHEDEPIAHPSSIPLHFVSKLAAEEVKVVLTGEGSDELMAGYERYYQTLNNLRFGRWVPGPLRTMARQVIGRLPDRSWLKRKAVRTSCYLPNDVDSLYLDNYSAFWRKDVTAALRPEYRQLAGEGIYRHFGELMQAADSDELLDQLLYADMKTYLLELLMKQDQMSMSASLESRVPFLDHELVEFVCSLPSEYKLKGFETKRILRHALGDTVPSAIVTRSKKGFPTPTKEWFRGAYSGHMRSLLLSSKTMLTEYIRPEYIEDTLQRHISGAWDLQEQLWTLGNLELWLRIAIDGQSPDMAFQPEEGAVTCASSG